MSEQLTGEQYKELSDVSDKFSNVFSEMPSVTDNVEHHIDTSSAFPIRESWRW